MLTSQKRVGAAVLLTIALTPFLREATWRLSLVPLSAAPKCFLRSTAKVSLGTLTVHVFSLTCLDLCELVFCSRESCSILNNGLVHKWLLATCVTALTMRLDELVCPHSGFHL